MKILFFILFFIPFVLFGQNKNDEDFDVSQSSSIRNFNIPKKSLSLQFGPNKSYLSFTLDFKKKLTNSFGWFISLEYHLFNNIDKDKFSVYNYTLNEDITHIGGTFGAYYMSYFDTYSSKLFNRINFNVLFGPAIGNEKRELDKNIYATLDNGAFLFNKVIYGVIGNIEMDFLISSNFFLKAGLKNYYYMNAYVNYFFALTGGLQFNF